MHRYSLQPQTVKTIRAVRQSTRWKPKITASITDSIDEALENLENDKSDVKVFTDGSGMEGKIGMAAILYQNGRMKAKL